MDEAISVLEKLVARDPGFAPGWAFLPRLQSSPVSPCFRTGPIEDARRFCQSAAKAEMAAHAFNWIPGTRWIWALAEIQAESGKWPEAEDLFKQALALDPTTRSSVQLRTMLGNVGASRNYFFRENCGRWSPCSVYNIISRLGHAVNGQYAASIPILEAVSAALAHRNVLLAQAYAAAGRYSDAADALLAIQGNQVTRQSVEDAARYPTAPTRQAPGGLPALEGS